MPSRPLHFRRTHTPRAAVAVAVASALVWGAAGAAAQRGAGTGEGSETRDVAKESAAPRRETFEDFGILTARNIFDPERGRPAPERPSRPDPPERREHVDLLGVLLYNEGAVAFFEGSDRDYSGAFKQGDKIAEYRIGAIDTSKVTLEKDGERIGMPMQARLERHGEGKWNLEEGAAGRGDQQPPAGGETAKTTADSEKAGDEAGGDAESELLKKMMERRKQEIR